MRLRTSWIGGRNGDWIIEAPAGGSCDSPVHWIHRWDGLSAGRPTAVPRRRGKTILNGRVHSCFWAVAYRPRAHQVFLWVRDRRFGAEFGGSVGRVSHRTFALLGESH